MAKPRFIPALRFRFLTSLFDGFLKATMREISIKTELIDSAQIDERQTVLDFGCGTGTLIKMLLDRFPHLNVVGLDVDGEVLGLARAKLVPLEPELVLYDGVIIPLSDGYFDTVLTSLAVHHIASSQKVALFGELKRVLKPGGRIFILDFTKPNDWYSQLVTGILRLLEPIDDNLQGKVPLMLEEAGFVEVLTRGYFRTGFGALALVSGRRP